MDPQVSIQDAALLVGVRGNAGPDHLQGELQGYASVGMLQTNRPALKPEDEPQKWVQCAKCSLWRKVIVMILAGLLVADVSLAARRPSCETRLQSCYFKRKCTVEVAYLF
jgi:hypothetical protein